MRKTRKSSLFLIELIVAILFFALSAAICVRLFAAAYLTSQESAYRDAAMLQAQSMASLYQSDEGALDDLLAFASASEVQAGVYAGTITQNDEEYAITLTLSDDGRCPILTIDITAPNAAQGDAPIVSLQTAVYQPLSVGEVA